jgi:hypothetical protein
MAFVYIWYFSAALHADTCDTLRRTRIADHDLAFYVLVVGVLSGLAAAWILAVAEGKSSHPGRGLLLGTLLGFGVIALGALTLLVLGFTPMCG